MSTKKTALSLAVGTAFAGSLLGLLLSYYLNLPAGPAIVLTLGAAYLLWLAWQAWRAAGTSAAGTIRASGALSARQYFLRGIAMNLSNPKVSLFFLAFLPQFTDLRTGPVWQQILILGATFTLTGTLVTMAYGALAGLLRKSLASRMSLLNRLAGGMLALLAVRLVAD